MMRDDAAKAARAWLVRLQDMDVSVEEIAEWQAWLAESDVHKEAYAETERVWALSARLDLAEDAPAFGEVASDAYVGDVSVAEWRRAQSEREPVSASRPKRRLIHPFAMAVAASVLVLAAGAAVLMQPWFASNVVDGRLAASITTVRAEHRSATLFDGSKIDVGGASDVAVDFTGAERIVVLTQGEAYFDVAPDPDQPFVVRTPLGDVTAIGTAFNVRLAEDKIVVTVTEGKVDVRPGAAPRSERDGDRREAAEPPVRVEAGSTLVYSLRDAAGVTPAAPVSWREGRFIYRSEPLKYVIADINRYSDVSVELADDAAAMLTYSGTMRPTAVREWAAALPAVFPVEVEQRGDGRISIRTRS